jgi:prepilin-type N-terminal cleavage/methylation domain-containing protein/prepilin-type processing-associated H-X9-DG protein
MQPMKRAFTLIELLVVIAIIAILAAILFPVFAQARSKARQASCLSNMKQMGLGVIMYANDYDETYPPAIIRAGSACNGGAGCRGMASWKTVTYPYTKNISIYECPELRAPFSKFYDSASTNAQYSVLDDEVGAYCDPKSAIYGLEGPQPYCSYSNGLYFPRGYSLNGVVFGTSFSIPDGKVYGDDGLAWFSSAVTLADVPQAADTAMICDTKSWNADMLAGANARCHKEMGISHSPMLVAYADTTSPTGKRLAIGWWVSHNKGVQFTYADGHSKFTRLQSIYSRNDLKYDCQKNSTDERTWPYNSFTTGVCNTAAVDGPSCAARAAALVAAEYI